MQPKPRDKGAAAARRTGSDVSGGKTKRHSWSALLNVSRSHDVSAAPRRDREQALPVAQKKAVEVRYRSATKSAPQSRASSPEPQSQPRPSSSRGGSSSSPQVPNLFKTLPTWPDTRGLPTILESEINTASMESLRSRVDGSKVKRWEGNTRTTSPWNDIRRDPELYHDRANCIVHLYTKGQSQRGPSIRVPLDTIYNARFEAIFAIFFAEIRAGGSSLRLLAGASRPSKSTLCDVYIPSPDNTSRTAALAWHLATRNFFAFLTDKPLVGNSLSEALFELQERLELIRPNDPRNTDELMDYFERNGYLNFSHCPDYALAFLRFAERSQLYDLWVDAFVHSVGMNEMLTLSTEFNKVSHVSRALITRAYLEMDLHLGRVTRALSNFLEEDFSPAHLGLGIGQRAHLDRFRSFLHSYYVEKFGYWPPPSGSRFSKSLYKSMYFDFRSLYDFLVDMDSSDSLVDQKPASGGICVLQNVQAFDARHKYIPLPHPLPLLPEGASETHRSSSQRALRSLKFGGKQAKTEKYFTGRDALAAATNSADFEVTYAPLVKEYRKFEWECTRRPDERISTGDARKVRWIVIYGTLQMLVSVIRAPKEVRDVDTPTYPLCCLVSRLAPWLGGAMSLKAPRFESLNISEQVSTDGFHSSPPTPQIVSEEVNTRLIQPDCEGDEYFTHTYVASAAETIVSNYRTTSDGAVTPPVRSSGVLRNSSFRSVTSFARSSFGSRRGSQIIKPVPLAPVAAPRKHMPIVVLGYGNGQNYGLDLKPNEIPIEYSAETFPEVVPETVILAQSPSVSRPGSSHLSERFSRRNTYPELLVSSHVEIVEDAERTPTLKCTDIDTMSSSMNGQVEDFDCPSDVSNSTPLTPSCSSRSSSTSSSSSVEEGHTSESRRASMGAMSTCSTNSTLLASPVELPIAKDGGITISSSLSVERLLLQKVDVQDKIVLPKTLIPVVVTETPSGPQVYTPSGYRTSSVASNRSQRSAYWSNSAAANALSARRHSLVTGTLNKITSDSLRNSGFEGLRNSGFHTLAENSETSTSRIAAVTSSAPASPITKQIVSRSDLPSARSAINKPTPMIVRDAATKTKTALRSSLKRSDAVAGTREKKRRSVRIKDDIDLLQGIDFSEIVA